jgi:NitT/TauT family transport system permease protein
MNKSLHIWTLAGIILLIAVWWLVSLATGPLVLPAPGPVFQTLGTMLGEPAFYSQLGISLLRLVIMLAIAAPVGIALALPAAFDRRLEQLLEPLRWTSMSVPPIIVVVILMYSLGMGTQMIVTFGVLILWPVMYINVLKGCAAIDADLLEMARLHRFSRYTRLRHLILPAVMPAILAGAAQVGCGAVRVVILAEVIGADSGIGAAIASNASRLETTRMTAWSLVALLLAVALEFAVLRPLQKRAYRWKSELWTKKYMKTVITGTAHESLESTRI